MSFFAFSWDEALEIAGARFAETDHRQRIQLCRCGAPNYGRHYVIQDAA